MMEVNVKIRYYRQLDDIMDRFSDKITLKFVFYRNYPDYLGDEVKLLETDKIYRGYYYKCKPIRSITNKNWEIQGSYCISSSDFIVVMDVNKNWLNKLNIKTSNEFEYYIYNELFKGKLCICKARKTNNYFILDIGYLNRDFRNIDEIAKKYPNSIVEEEYKIWKLGEKNIIIYDDNENWNFIWKYYLINGMLMPGEL